MIADDIQKLLDDIKTEYIKELDGYNKRDRELITKFVTNLFNRYIIDIIQVSMKIKFDEGGFDEDELYKDGFDKEGMKAMGKIFSIVPELEKDEIEKVFNLYMDEFIDIINKAKTNEELLTLIREKIKE
ncbi:hypothetical protein [Mycobacterium sp.]|uniref:hypothetical protein n=1 Tax=Mycobacterium sp. TaxID=1785 RepID=UPI0031D41542